ncbi:hypothetical protein ESA94_19970 [Lacibacter luteus]|uniref:DUF4595 domain-containing protein n=1 Tax=Lacibacter luteus TaxID=2508719 RepID=A0A4V1M717_9BACT|nr:hypothetical protein [Lacibacter luteus]RXK57799.1 hypothetical protein ESA94_19970 [Lacibacter luteus]
MKFNLGKAVWLLVITVSASSFFISCKKPTSEPLPVTKIKTVVSTDDELIFEYNSNGTVKTVQLRNSFVTSGDLVNYQVHYNQQGKISEIISDEDIRIVPVYVEGKLKEAAFKTLAGDLLLQTDYAYLDERLKTITITTAAGQPWMRFGFDYNAQGNIAKTSFFVQDPLNPNQFISSGTVAYTYDAKINPLNEVNDVLHLLWLAVNPNNILSEIHKDRDGLLEETVNYNYQYHSNNTPKSAVMQSTVPGQATENVQLFFVYF